MRRYRNKQKFKKRIKNVCKEKIKMYVNKTENVSKKCNNVCKEKVKMCKVGRCILYK